MRLRTTIPALFLLALTALTPQAQAAASICSILAPASPVPTPFLVPPGPNALGGPCTVIPFGLPAATTGTVFTSTTAPCPPAPINFVLAGELCSIPIAPLQTVTCTASIPAGSNIDQVQLKALVLGVDYDGNGNVLQPTPPLGFEPLRHNVALQPVFTISTTYTNTSPLSGRVIAYPLAAAPVFVGCL